ncbi:hypothetical protein I308_104013 [Cryptococcus tetragattii IND107]|uniref:Uncharacterized protein n=1 Tax=Cryptococcus tetragattii IND107 TaxID=1296105 RepID=A0ABR3BP56_9TREE
MGANQHFIRRFQHLSFQNQTASSTIQDEDVDVADVETEDGEEETEQGWWSMSPERMRRLKEKEDKAYIEAIRKVLREKGTPFFLLSPSQLDLPSGFCTSRSVHRNRWEWFMDFRIKAESNFYDSCLQIAETAYQSRFSKFEVRHLTTRDLETGKLSAFLTTSSTVWEDKCFSNYQKLLTLCVPGGAVVPYCVQRIRVLNFSPKSYAKAHYAKLKICKSASQPLLSRDGQYGWLQ